VVVLVFGGGGGGRGCGGGGVFGFMALVEEIMIWGQGKCPPSLASNPKKEEPGNVKRGFGRQVCREPLSTMSCQDFLSLLGG